MLVQELTPISHSRLGANLPPVVERYLSKVLPKEREFIRGIRLVQIGKMKNTMKVPRWLTFRAEEEISASDPSFTWNGRVRLYPGIWMDVIDRLDNGKGAGELRLLSILPLKQVLGDQRFLESSLQRYLAECVWCPENFLNPAISWTQTSDHCARATFEDHGTKVELDFTFGDDSLVCEVSTNARWRMTNDGFEATAWKGSFKKYRDLEGYIIPLESEAFWAQNGMWQLVWCADIKQARILR